MFGYITGDTPYLYMKDVTLYRAMYCGLCKSLGKNCGLRARIVLNYDLTFLSIFLHNILGKDVKIEKERCYIHWITKRPVAQPDEISLRVADLNVILSYYKLKDDINDSGKGKFGTLYLKSAYKKAKKREPSLDKVIKDKYEYLLKKEREHCNSLDIIADPFGQMMQEIIKIMTGDKYTEDIGQLSYQLGKWIYLIDALDDFDKDKKKNEYNVLIEANKDVKNFEELKQKNISEILTVLTTVMSDIKEKTNKITYLFNHDLIDNILMRGIVKRTSNVMEGKKCKNTTKF